ncbi:MAG TPA: DNA-3-methyladenine glycosylase [Candidatus Saccharimonadales bacterium]
MNEDFGFLEGDAVEAAQRLLGCVLVREIDGQQLIGRIVETEAYHQTDAASHSYKGKTPRTENMFGPAGHLYVYFTYGMHYCMNIVTGQEGEGSAVLIRAVEPLAGEAVMSRNRHGLSGVQLTNGPAKVCQALAIDKAWNGHDLSQPPLQLHIEPALSSDDIVAATRIGITRDVHRLWRFYVRGSGFVSRR